MTDLTGALGRIEAALKQAKRLAEPTVAETQFHKDVVQALSDCQAIREAVPDDLAEALGALKDRGHSDYWDHEDTAIVAAQILHQITPEQKND